MEIKIGVQHAPRELVIDTNEDADAVAAIVTGGGPFLTLTDTKGRRILVPTDKIAYVEIGSPSASTVGFRG